jgi:hypothetical protein
MDIFKRVLAVFLLVLFVAYSGGVGFSIHNCGHCQQKRIYLFQHPDCCSAAAEEHHHQADNCGKSCKHQNKKTSGSRKDANAPHCQPCCFSNYQFYKIQGSYFAPKYEKLVNSADFLVFTERMPLDFTQVIFEKMDFPISNPDPPPLLPGGERFLVFSHQLLFYA